MDYSARYELLDKLGAGSFAAVYRARDKELGREVAIKVIHQQYREDPKLLDRYWQEAQLLASMQHPNIVTVFDVVRERGWLVMELMMSNLGQRLDGKQMDLRSLRTTLAHSLRALKYLHSRGIIHGDIKPGNMMIDARKRIKIGDFGLARRVSDEEGSLLKGTTKYIAPEVVSDELGEVGPQSDLYSLGFSAYELICGTENFEDLFPGLSAFGKDKQLAWMMWHAAPDRKLPELNRVLQGVPDDLAHVIQKLIEKDPKKRYASADAALAELKVDQTVIKEVKQDSIEKPEQKSNKFRIYLAAIAFSLSVLISLAVLFMPQGGGPKKSPSRKLGVIRSINLDDRLLVIEDPATGIPEEYKISQKPKLYLESEKKNILLRELLAGDRVAIDTIIDSSGNKVYELIIARAVHSTGTIQNINLSEQKIVASIDEGEYRGNLTLNVPEKVKFNLNGTPVLFQDLLVGDKAAFDHFIPPAGKGDRILDKVNVTRKMQTRGYIQSLDKSSQTLLIRYGRNSSRTTFQKKLAADCTFQLADGKTLTIDDLQVDDRVELNYEEYIQQVSVIRAAQRYDGYITEINRNTNVITVRNSQGTDKLFTTDNQSQITLQLDKVNLPDLRIFDSVEILFNDAENPLKIKTLDAVRPVKNDRWGIIIGVEKYEDKSLSPVNHALTDARYLQETLINKYCFSKDRIKTILNPDKKQLLSSLKSILEYSKPQTQVIIYYNGHSYIGPDNKPYLAPVDFRFDKMAETGVSLEEFVTMIDESPSQQKLILFDGTQNGFGKDLEQEPSGRTQFSKISYPRKSTDVIASCDDGQRSYTVLNQHRGFFAQAVADGFTGAADANFDLNITAAELQAYLEKHTSELKTQDAGIQKPVLLPR